MAQLGLGKPDYEYNELYFDAGGRMAGATTLVYRFQMRVEAITPGVCGGMFDLYMGVPPPPDYMSGKSQCSCLASMPNYTPHLTCRRLSSAHAPTSHQPRTRPPESTPQSLQAPQQSLET